MKVLRSRQIADVIGTDDSRTQSYTAFVNCLKYNQNFAPAYTGLGLFYADVANDEKRAYKCFQKAFELDAGEVDAAERLAQDFAESRQWDLVEVVARRVLQASRKRLSTRRELSWPHRALGVAELVPTFKDALISRMNEITREQYSPSKLHCATSQMMSTRGSASAKRTQNRVATPQP
jgi:hypothetical protein